MSVALVRASVAAALVSLSLLSAGLGAQQPPVTHLVRANGRLAKAFPKRAMDEFLGGPMQVRELSDGRLLINTWGRGPLLVGNFSTGEVQPLTGLPSGWLRSLPGDTSIVGSPRGWTFLVGERPIGGLPRDNPVVQLVSAGMAQQPDGLDNRGFVLAKQHPQRPSDSLEAILISRASGDIQVITRLRLGAPPPPGAFRPVCLLYERAVLAPDGWVAVVRIDPYRVDWRSPEGEWTRGAPIPTPTIPTTERERQIYLEWRAREKPPRPQDSVVYWPETVCPWVSGYAPIASPDGKLLIYRVPTSQAPATRYDVINRHGAVERQLALPASEAILGFGRNSVVVVVTEGQTQRIERHPWP